MTRSVPLGQPAMPADAAPVGREGAACPGNGRPGNGDGRPPRHVAIIMDGNGRWAKKRLLPRIAGHRAGVEAVRRIVKAAPTLGIEVLTLYAFSSENWRRPADEVSDLMGLLHHYLLAEIEDLDRNNVRFDLIGDWRALRPGLVGHLERAIARTRANDGLRLIIALNYGAQDELVRAFRHLASNVERGALSPAEITPALVDAALDTAGQPPLDLVIRSSGEQRLSNFLLWQAAYAELLFVDTLWPDFDSDTLAAAVRTFTHRERRYGGR